MEAGTASAIRGSEIMLCYVWEVLFFSNTPTWFSVAGGICVFLSVLGVSLQKIKYINEERERNPLLVHQAGNPWENDAASNLL